MKDYMNLLNNKKYVNDIIKVSNLKFINFEMLKNKSIAISGATGMIGSFLIDVIMYLNKEKQLNCQIYALGRTENRAMERFANYWNDVLFTFISQDINETIKINELSKIDYVLHLASNTHPRIYATDPIGTITTNVIGTKNMLDFAQKNKVERFVFASTCEVYGENRGDVEKFSEDYLGYIDCNTLRAGYPESKRCGEALCQAYIKQENMDIVIPRLARTYGPTMLMDDTKAISQFIKNGINKEDIVLKSEGNQHYSFIYVADAVSGILTVMLAGKKGEAYNIADEESDIKLKDLATLIAKISNTAVVFDLPDEIEKEGFSRATKARLSPNKLKELGWKAQYNINTGVENTLNIL